MVSCDRCPAEAVLTARYSGASACREHFLSSVDQRVRRALRRQRRLPRSGALAVALSGGKDSTVALHVLRQAWAHWPSLRWLGVTVDEGISGYRPGGVRAAAALCTELGVEHRVVPISAVLGTTIDVVASLPTAGGSPCSYCGVGRRTALNATALRWGADTLATGHNLDDVAQTVLMNLAKGDVDRLGRSAPHHEAHPGLVPRLLPLLHIPEQEVYLYALLRQLPFHGQQCPHSGAALRNTFRRVLLELEDRHPGTRHALLRSHERIAAALQGPAPPRAGAASTASATVLQVADLLRCSSCGQPTRQERCEACRARGELVALLSP